MTIFTPKYIESKLYKTYPQRLRDWWANPHYREAVYCLLVASLVLITLTQLYSHRVDKPGTIAGWKVENQRTGSIGTGAMILNADGKVQ